MKNLYKPIHKRVCVILTLVLLSVALTGCTIPISFNMPSNSAMTIPKTAFSQSADTTEEIVQAIIASMDSDNNVCELFITDEELIDANKWLSLINGIEQLRCWDNSAIIKAYRSESTYNLNERQLVLYDKYTKILEEIISPNQSDIEKEIAIHDYLVDNINYVDTGDSSYNAYSALINGIAVCSGYTECFKTLLDMLGIENATISGEAGGQQHIWNVVNLDNHWYHVDVTWDERGNIKNRTAVILFL